MNLAEQVNALRGALEKKLVAARHWRSCTTCCECDRCGKSENDCKCKRASSTTGPCDVWDRLMQQADDADGECLALLNAIDALEEKP